MKYFKKSHKLPFVFGTCFAFGIVCLFWVYVYICYHHSNINTFETKKRLNINDCISDNAINLSYMDITNNELLDFISFTSKAELYLNDNHTLYDNVSDFLQNFTQIKLLNISQTRISEKSFNPTHEFCYLEFLQVGWRCYPHPDDVSELPVFSDMFLDSLNAPALKELIIHRNCTITNDGLKTLIKYPHLERIILHSPFITEDGIKKLIDEMHNKKTITYRIADQEPSHPSFSMREEEISYKIEIEFADP